MKKYLVLVAIIGFSVATLYSCDNSNSGNSNYQPQKQISSITQTELEAQALEKEIQELITEKKKFSYSNWQDACANNDYVAAYEILAEMKNKVETMRQSTFTPKKKRIAAQDEYYEAKRVVEAQEKLWLQGLVDAACDKNDFERAHLLVREIKKNKGEGLVNLMQVVERESKFILSMNIDDATLRIQYLLEELKPEGTEFAEGICMQMDYDKNCDWLCNDDLKQFNAYIKWCREFNTTCHSIQKTAITFGNQDVSKRIIQMFRPDPEILYKKSTKYPKNTSYADVYAHYTKRSLDAAQQKYDEAVKSGVFNN